MNSFISQTQVFQLVSALSNTKSWTQGRTIPSSVGAGFHAGQAVGINADGSSGSGNYNALYVTFTTHDSPASLRHFKLYVGLRIGHRQ